VLRTLFDADSRGDLRLARDETDERARLDRVRDVQTSLKAITQRSAETGARADASLARGSSPKRRIDR
jgi:hypothetical protein